MRNEFLKLPLLTFSSTFPPHRSQSHTVSCPPVSCSDESDCSDEAAVTSNCPLSVLPQSTPTRSKNKHTPPSESSQATSSSNTERQTKGRFFFSPSQTESVKGRGRESQKKKKNKDGRQSFVFNLILEGGREKKHRKAGKNSRSLEDPAGFSAASPRL